MRRPGPSTDEVWDFLTQPPLRQDIMSDILDAVAQLDSMNENRDRYISVTPAMADLIKARMPPLSMAQDVLVAERRVDYVMGMPLRVNSALPEGTCVVMPSPRSSFS